MGAEAFLDLFQTKFASSRQGYLATMDWSQAFDRLNAEATFRALHLNFCPPLTELQQVWLKQQCYVRDRFIPKSLPLKVSLKVVPLAP